MKRKKTPDEVFKEVEATFQKAVTKFLHQYKAKMYRIYASDMKSAAAVGFMDALTSFDKKHNTDFKSWVWTKVWGKMLDELRKHVRLSRRYDSLTNDQEHYLPPSFDREDFLHKLGPDARHAALVALDNPIELQFILAIMGQETTPNNIREAIRQHFLELGWTKVRIQRAFEEVKRALK